MTKPGHCCRGHSPEVQQLARELRGLVKALMPRATERVHPGWGTIHYRAGEKMRDVVVALVPHSAHVNLEFADGVELPDPAGRLDGTGKRIRHVKVRGVEDVRSPEVRALLEAATRRRGVGPDDTEGR